MQTLGEYVYTTNAAKNVSKLWANNFSYIEDIDTAPNTDNANGRGLIVNATHIRILDGTDRVVYIYLIDGTYTGNFWNWSDNITGAGDFTSNGTYMWVTNAATTPDRIVKFWDNGTYTGIYGEVNTSNIYGIDNNLTDFFVVDVTLDDMFIFDMGVELAPDTTPPEFTLIPSNQTLEYNNPLSVDFNANEAVTWSVNNTAFTINSNGLLTNNTILSLGTYPLNITIKDTSGNQNDTGYSVTINQNTGSCSVLFSATSPIYNTSSFNVWSDCNSDFTLYKNGSSILNNSLQSLGTGTYNFTAIRTDRDNYSNIYDEETFRVNDAPPAPPECSAYEKLGNSLIQLAGVLLILGSAVFIAWKNDWFDFTVGQLIIMFIIIIVGIALFMASVNTMAEGCLQ
jgi:hypothetical protein